MVFSMLLMAPDSNLHFCTSGNGKRARDPYPADCNQQVPVYKENNGLYGMSKNTFLSCLFFMTGFQE
jgi:hypothetical protein